MPITGRASPSRFPSSRPAPLDSEPEIAAGPAVSAVADGAVSGILRDDTPSLRARAERALPKGWVYYFAVDADPDFRSPWIQRSTDEPWLFRAIKKNIIFLGLVSVWAATSSCRFWGCRSCSYSAT